MTKSITNERAVEALNVLNEGRASLPQHAKAYFDMRHFIDQSAALIEQVKTSELEVERCHRRLEIDRVCKFSELDERTEEVDIPKQERADQIDGIECRDDTIRLLEQNRKALVARRDDLLASNNMLLERARAAEAERDEQSADRIALSAKLLDIERARKAELDALTAANQTVAALTVENERLKLEDMALTAERDSLAWLLNPDLEALADEAANAKHHVRVLAETIQTLAVNCGIVAVDTPLTGPDLLMLAEDIQRNLKSLTVERDELKGAAQVFVTARLDEETTIERVAAFSHSSHAIQTARRKTVDAFKALRAALKGVESSQPKDSGNG